MSVGKFTTANELSKLTGYKLFHNHLTVEAVSSIFPEKEPPYSSIISQIRLTMLDEAAKAGRDTIFTFGYSGAVDDDQVRHIVEAVESHGGEVDFVQLYAPQGELLKHRIEGNSRKAMAKETDPKRLRKVLAERDMYATVPYSNNLRINNSELPPGQAARQIVSHFDLPLLRSR